MLNMEYFGYGCGLVMFAWLSGMIAGIFFNVLRKF